METLIVFLEENEQNFCPQFGSDGAAGLDILAAEDAIILPGQTKLVSTALKMAIPKGYEIQIRPRSGLSLKTSLRIPNSPGTIDSDYRDEIKVICQNHKPFDTWKDDLLMNPSLIDELKDYQEISYYDYLVASHQNEELSSLSKKQKEFLQNQILYVDEQGIPYGSIHIKKNERFAQMVFAKYVCPEFKMVQDVSEIGHNRGGGFGSTGVKG